MTFDRFGDALAADNLKQFIADVDEILIARDNNNMDLREETHARGHWTRGSSAEDSAYSLMLMRRGLLGGRL